MRQQLMDTFTDIYLFDLHGNAKKKERAPDGSPDQNVFDIQQGVAIALFVKQAGKNGPASSCITPICGGNAGRASTKPWPLRIVSTTAWETNRAKVAQLYVQAVEPRNLRKSTRWWPKITEIMPGQLGRIVITARDKLTIHWTSAHAA